MPDLTYRTTTLLHLIEQSRACRTPHLTLLPRQLVGIIWKARSVSTAIQKTVTAPTIESASPSQPCSDAAGTASGKALRG